VGNHPGLPGPRSPSWEQRQNIPSPTARRLLGLIASDPHYWKDRFISLIEARRGEQQSPVEKASKPVS